MRSRHPYLKAPEGEIIDIDEAHNYTPDKIVIITTGSQGEPMSALTRMAMNDHKKVDIMPGDTVIISATPIPGNEKLVSRTIDHLYKLGADVIYEKSNGVHVSGLWIKVCSIVVQPGMPRWNFLPEAWK